MLRKQVKDLCFGSLINFHLVDCFAKLIEVEFILVWQLSVLFSQLLKIAHIQICIDLVSRLEIGREEVAEQEALRGEDLLAQLNFVIAAFEVYRFLSADCIDVGRNWNLWYVLASTSSLSLLQHAIRFQAGIVEEEGRLEV